jgi:predicted nucleic acid-binding Zn ribbon protein
MRRTAPRPLAAALAAVTREIEPQTPIARVQTAWRATAGQALLEEAEPVSERAGVVTVACRSAVWAQELALLEPELVERLNGALGRSPGTPVVERLRFVVGRPRGEA